MTVDTLLEATAQVLVSSGYERASTDAIAARAGVSIGTLYQYFPNKASLVAALIRQHVDEVLYLVETALAEHEGSPLDTTLRALVRAGIEAHRLNPPLHKVLFEQVPTEQILGQAPDVSSRLQAMIEAVLRRKLPGISRTRTRTVALVLETSIEALTHRAVVEAPDWLRSGALEKEAVALLKPYLLQALR
ncbi:TetR/AcrR family transcriptional regulator [Panacagrimonas sp.]|uniref:TetR/AcrR family transcriptional regulator n=1 Tax=Panacagrimonas sp. TaxID=2480088 RepID=UPI003B521521